MAVTVDDLPTHGATPSGMSRLEIARRLVRALKQHGVPEVYGFMNGGQARENPEHLDILKAWVQAGFRLGNHTFSHLDLNRVTASQYIADIERNEALFLELSDSKSFRWFRYPYLNEGDSLDKRNAVRRWLAARGYRIAPVSVDFYDWAWNDPYARCLSKGDSGSTEWLKQSFMDVAMSRLKWSKEASNLIFKRQIKQILLLHIGAFDALMLDEVLNAYKTAGVKFIGLNTAGRDVAYALNPDIVWEGELTFLEQLAQSKHMALPPKPEAPLKVLESLCR